MRYINSRLTWLRSTKSSSWSARTLDGVHHTFTIYIRCEVEQATKTSRQLLFETWHGQRRLLTRPVAFIQSVTSMRNTL